MREELGRRGERRLGYGEGEERNGYDMREELGRR
jgi:hypothetical protein